MTQQHLVRTSPCDSGVALAPPRWHSRRSAARAGAQAWSRARTTSASRTRMPVETRQEDRGDRVLLVRLPALRRARAVSSRHGSTKLPPDVVFRRVPVMFQARWEHARPRSTTRSTRWARSASCRRTCSRRSTARARALWNDKTFFDWAASKGLDRKKVEDVYNSFAINGKMNRAQAAGAGVQHPVGAHGRRRRQVHHRLRARRHARAAARGDRRADRQGARRTAEGLTLAADGSRDAPCASRAERLPHRRVVGHRRGARARITRATARRSGCSRGARPSSTRLAAALAPATRRDLRGRRARRRRARALPAADFIARFGVPDVVIANAGVSRGTLTEHAEDLPVFRAVFDTNVLGMVHTFQPFVAPMRAARTRHAGRHRERRGLSRPSGLGRVFGVEGRGDHLPREPARRAARQRRARS